MMQIIMKRNACIKIYIVRKPRCETKAAQPCPLSAQNYCNKWSVMVSDNYCLWWKLFNTRQLDRLRPDIYKNWKSALKNQHYYKFHPASPPPWKKVCVTVCYLFFRPEVKKIITWACFPARLFTIPYFPWERRDRALCVTGGHLHTIIFKEL